MTFESPADMIYKEFYIQFCTDGIKHPNAYQETFESIHIEEILENLNDFNLIDFQEITVINEEGFKRTTTKTS